MLRCLLAAVTLVGALSAQSPPSSSPADLERRLKDAVDQRLATFVRELRAELHRAIEEAVAGPGAEKLDDVLSRLAGGKTVVAPKALADLDDNTLRRVHRIRTRLASLQRQLGPGHAQVAAIRGMLREQVGALADAPIPDWSRLGIEVAPASGAFRTLYGLPPRVGFVVTGASSPGQPPVGTVLVGFSGEPLGAGTPGEARLAARLSAAGGAPIRFETVARGTRAQVPLTLVLKGAAVAIPDDPKTLIDEMLRKAIRDIVPPGGIIAPGESGKSGEKKLTPQRQRP
ncbi:MAG: hypothetical protein CMJ83_04655 [Planctomycetes bacterium]|nr:hypothetical protein [Planctomycetota bacterium]